MLQHGSVLLVAARSMNLI